MPYRRYASTYRRPSFYTRYRVSKFRRGPRYFRRSRRRYPTVRRQMAGEIMKTNLTIDNTPGVGGFIIPLHEISQGDNIGNRRGNQIKVSRININIDARMNSAATATLMRWILFYDTQQQGDSDPVIADVLEDAGSSRVPRSFLNRETVGRFKIVKDWRFVLDNVRQPLVQRAFSFGVNHFVRYNGTAATDIQKGGIYVLICSDELVNLPSVNQTFRLHFYDN